MRTQLDHLVICVSDLDELADRLLDKWGLASVVGGRHQGHGTANRIVPLGDSYLEFVTVVDVEEAGTSRFGSFVAERMQSPPGVDALCLRTDKIDAVCSRLDLEATAMSRETPDGTRLAWRLAGLERALNDGVPFFIQWEVAEEGLPGRTEVDHQVEVLGVRVSVGGDPEFMLAWLGEVQGVSVVSGGPGLSGAIATSGGVIDLPAALSFDR